MNVKNRFYKEKMIIMNEEMIFKRINANNSIKEMKVGKKGY